MHCINDVLKFVCMSLYIFYNYYVCMFYTLGLCMYRFAFVFRYFTVSLCMYTKHGGLTLLDLSLKTCAPLMYVRNKNPLINNII